MWIFSPYPCYLTPYTDIQIGKVVEEDFTQILQFHDSFPRCVESYRYEDDASFMSSSATRLRKIRLVLYIQCLCRHSAGSLVLKSNCTIQSDTVNVFFIRYIHFVCVLLINI